MRAATFPAANNVVALGDQVGGAPEIEVRKCFAEIGHERLDVLTAAARLVQRILQKHVRRGEFIDDAEIAGLAPEIGEPTAHDCLVVIFLGHSKKLLKCVVDNREAECPPSVSTISR